MKRLVVALAVIALAGLLLGALANRSRDIADALGMVHGGSLQGEPEKLVQRALEIDRADCRPWRICSAVEHPDISPVGDDRVERGFDRGIRHWDSRLV